MGAIVLVAYLEVKNKEQEFLEKLERLSNKKTFQEKVNELIEKHKNG